MGRIRLSIGLVVGYGYMMEAFMAWYSGNPYEQFMIINRFMGPYRYMYWGLLVCNVLAPQALWFQRVRASTVALMIVCMFVNVGMWLERYIIVVVSLSADFLPSSWLTGSAGTGPRTSEASDLPHPVLPLIPSCRAIFEMRACCPKRSSRRSRSR
jgi:hypothetical protein